MARSIGGAALALITACSGPGDRADAAGPIDAGSGAADGAAAPGAQIPWLDEGAPPVAPPAPPSLAPCPDGWREIATPGGAVACDPYPEGGPLDCPPGEAQFPGESGCAPIGRACPTGDFPDDVPPGALYVLAGATGGDGSRARPFATIAEGLRTAAIGATVVVGRGAYDEVLAFSADVVVRGACAAGTRISASAADARPAVVNVTRVSARLQDVSIADSDRTGISITLGGELEVSGVEIRSVANTGAILEGPGSTLTGERLVIRDTRGRSGDRFFGRGLTALDGVTVELSRLAVERNRNIGIEIRGSGATATIEDVVVRDTLDDEGRPEFAGRGVYVDEGAIVTLSRAILEGNSEFAMIALETATELRVSQAVVRDTRSSSFTGLSGEGARADLGAHVVLSRVLFHRNRGAAAVTVTGAILELTDVIAWQTESSTGVPVNGFGLDVRGGSLTGERVWLEANVGFGLGVLDEGQARLSDLVVRDTRPVRGGGYGRGIELQGGSVLTLERASIAGNRSIGIALSQTGTSGDLTDVAVSDTAPQESDGLEGIGLLVQVGATARASRVLLEGNATAGAAAIETGSVLLLEDALVRGTVAAPGRPDSVQGVGAGIGGSVELSRVLIVDNALGGIGAIGEGTSLTATDLLVRASRSSPDGLFGRGVSVEEGATATLVRTTLEANREVGLVAHGGGASATLRDSVIRGTEPRPDGNGGFGIAIVDGSLVTERTLLEANHVAGIVLNGATTTARFDSVTVRGTRSRPADGQNGRGVSIENGARLDAFASVFEDNQEIGVLAIGAGTSAALSDVVVRATRPQRDGNTGIGIGAYEDAAVSVSGFTVSGNALVGVQLTRGGTVDLHDGEVSGHPVGVNVQTAGFDLTRLMDRVIYRDNDRNLDSSALPVPSGGVSVPE